MLMNNICLVREYIYIIIYIDERTTVYTYQKYFCGTNSPWISVENEPLYYRVATGRGEKSGEIWNFVESLGNLRKFIFHKRLR